MPAAPRHAGREECSSLMCSATRRTRTTTFLAGCPRATTPPPPSTTSHEHFLGARMGRGPALPGRHRQRPLTWPPASPCRQWADGLRLGHSHQRACTFAYKKGRADRPARGGFTVTKASQGRQGQRHVLQNVTGALAPSPEPVAVTSLSHHRHAADRGNSLCFSAQGPFGALLLKRTKKP